MNPHISLITSELQNLLQGEITLTVEEFNNCSDLDKNKFDMALEDLSPNYILKIEEMIDNLRGEENELPVEEKKNHLEDIQLKEEVTSAETGKTDSSAETGKTDSGNTEINEEELDFKKQNIDYKTNHFHSIEKSFKQLFRESTDFNPLFKTPRLIKIDSETLLGKKTKRNNKLSKPSALKKQKLTNLTSEQSFETSRGEDYYLRHPVWKINDSERTVTDISLVDNYSENEPGEESFEEPNYFNRNILENVTKEVIFRIIKVKKRFLVVSKSTHINSKSKTIDSDYPSKNNNFKVCKTYKMRELRKNQIDSINKKIKTNFFKFLANLIQEYNLFSQKLITDTNIDNNKFLIKQTISDIVYQALLIIYNEETTAQDELAIILNKPTVDQALFDCTFSKLYKDKYLYSEECNKKLTRLYEKESENYIESYESRLKDYVNYFKTTKGNVKKLARKGKIKGAKTKKITNSIKN